MPPCWDLFLFDQNLNMLHPLSSYSGVIYKYGIDADAKHLHELLKALPLPCDFIKCQRTD